MADATDSKSVVPCGHEGSNPSSGTKENGDTGNGVLDFFVALMI